MINSRMRWKIEAKRQKERENEKEKTINFTELFECDIEKYHSFITRHCHQKPFLAQDNA